MASSSNVHVKSEVFDFAHAEERVFQLIQAAHEGISLDQISAFTADIPAADRSVVINSLMSSKRVVIAQCSDGMRLKVNTNTQLSGATEEEQAIFNLIEESKTKGIWIRELRDGSGLMHAPLRKVLRTLEGKKLIKTVKAVGTTKKCYMLYNLEPDTSLTGGTFYSDQQLDAELINTLVNVCASYIQGRRTHALQTHPDDITLQKELSYVKTQEVSDFIVEKRILNVAISVDDLERILDVGILDGTIERRADGKLRACPQNVICSPLVCIPCGICPVVEDCKIGHVISPETCRYMNDWLEGK